MSKFKLGNHVRVIEPHHVMYDKAGEVVAVGKTGNMYGVRINHETYPLGGHDLVLADKERHG